MKRSDISDLEICKLIISFPEIGVYYKLVEIYGKENYKIIVRAIERALDRNLIEYGTSLCTCWLTEDGEKFLQKYGIYKFIIVPPK